MRNKIKTFGMLLLLTATVVAAQPEPPRGEWSCVALTPRVLALTGDYTELQRRLFLERMKARGERQLPRWAKDFRFNISGTEAIAMYRPQVVEMLKDTPKVRIRTPKGDVAVLRTGYWMSPIGQARFPDDNGRERLSRNADVAHYLFLELERPLEDAEALRITLPAGEELEFTYRKDRPSPLFRLNQIGYLPDAPKYAYLGAWLGTAGPLPLHREFSGAAFEVIDAATNRAVLTGKLAPRRQDPKSVKGTPFTGEEVLELDLSSVTAPGRYRLVVEKLGCSE